MVNSSIWQRVVKAFPEATFTQSPEWAKTSNIFGSKTFFLTNFEENSSKTPDNPYWALAILRDAKRGRYLEIPCGPLLDWNNSAIINEFFQKLVALAREEKCVFVRLRPQLLKTSENLEIMRRIGLKISPMHLAAEHTVIINLKPSEEELLANLRRQTRYEVRRAEKLGITVEKSNAEAIFDEFYQVQQKTAQRQNFIPPSHKLLQAERLGFEENIQIYTAKEGKKPIAYGLIIKSGREADYYEAASTELNRKLPGAYALLWQAIKDLKEEGYERFNLWGIAPPNSPHHRYAGVTTFKTGFGGEVVEYIPAHDLIVSKPKYLKNYLVEIIRKKKRHL